MSELTGETIRRDEHGEPTEVVQYAILDGGKHYIYGDQNWVAYGGAVRDGSHPDGRVQQRAVTVAYGPWVDGGPETVALPAKAPTPRELEAVPVDLPWRARRGEDVALDAGNMVTAEVEDGEVADRILTPHGGWVAIRLSPEGARAKAAALLAAADQAEASGMHYTVGDDGQPQIAPDPVEDTTAGTS